MTDIIDELLKEEIEEEEEKDLAEKLSLMEDKLKASDKEKHGLLDDIKRERRKRQDIRDRLNTLTDTVNTIVTNNKAKPADIIADAKKANGIPVDFDGDGEGTVNIDESVEAKIKPLLDKITNLESQLQLTTETTDATREADAIKTAVVGEDESYQGAYSKYQTALKWVDEKVVEFQKDHGITGQMNAGQALTHVFDDVTTKEFTDNFPEFDLIQTLTAEDSVPQFRMMLTNVAKAMTPNKNDNNTAKNKFAKVLRKPSGLSNTTNVKSGSNNPLNADTEFSTSDILNLSDAQVAALEKALLNEEQTDGIKF
jgi:hypothetical protein